MHRVRNGGAAQAVVVQEGITWKMGLDLCVNSHYLGKKEGGNHTQQTHPGHLFAHSKTTVLPRTPEDE